jgi:hypothetical protein
VSKNDYPWVYRQMARGLSRAVCGAGRSRWLSRPYQFFSTSVMRRYRISLAGAFPQRVDKGVLFLSCDERYYRDFGVHLVRSALKNCRGFNIHLHITCLSDGYRRELQQYADSHSAGLLSLTWDQLAFDNLSGQRRWYYLAAVRFVRLYQLVESCRAPVLSLDADGVVVRSLEQKFAQMAGCDAGIYLRLSNTLDWRKVLASALFVMPTPLGRRYIRDVAHAIAWLLDHELHYHVDQLVIYDMWRCYRATEPEFQVATLSQDLADWECRGESYVWSAKGDRKYCMAEFLNALED